MRCRFGGVPSSKVRFAWRREVGFPKNVFWKCSSTPHALAYGVTCYSFGLSSFSTHQPVWAFRSAQSAAASELSNGPKKFTASNMLPSATIHTSGIDSTSSAVPSSISDPLMRSRVGRLQRQPPRSPRARAAGRSRNPRPPACGSGRPYTAPVRLSVPSFRRSLSSSNGGQAGCLPPTVRQTFPAHTGPIPRSTLLASVRNAPHTQHTPVSTPHACASATVMRSVGVRL